MTLDVGARKYDAKKETMIANYHLDPEKWEKGLLAAGLPSVKPSRKRAYTNAESYAKENYSAKIRAVTGDYWKKRFIEAMSG